MTITCEYLLRLVFTAKKCLAYCCLHFASNIVYAVPSRRTQSQVDGVGEVRKSCRLTYYTAKQEYAHFIYDDRIGAVIQLQYDLLC